MILGRAASLVRAKVLNFVRDGATDDPRRWLAEQAEAAMKLEGVVKG